MYFYYSDSLNVNRCIERLKTGECISEKNLKRLCSKVSDLLMEESNVQPVVSPVTIVGDLHGQFFDLLNLLETGGWPPDTSYIFLGDFVDRGHNSVETLSLLLCLKLKYPGHVTLLRGNHEVRILLMPTKTLGLRNANETTLAIRLSAVSSDYPGLWILR